MPDTATRPSSANRIHCDEHRVWYNVGTSTGCPLCLAAQARLPEPGLPFSPFRIATILVAGGVLYVAMNRGLDALSATSEVYEKARITSSKLDPETFRTQIEAVEQAVYSQPPGEYGQGSEIFQAANDLSNAIRATRVGNAFVDGKIARHSQEILSFGTSVASQEDIGYAAFDQSQARSEWQTVRSQAFRDADWFRNPEPIPAQSASTGPRMTAGTVRALRDLSRDIDQLIRFTRSSAMRLGEPEHPRGSREARRLNEEWQNIRSAVASRLRSINSTLPDGKYLMSREGEDAHRYLELSANALGRLVPMTKVPWREERAQLLDVAAQYLRSADERLKDLR